MATIFVCSQFQLGSHIHACTNETHSLANLQGLIPAYFDRHDYRQHKLAKVWIKFCKFASNKTYKSTYLGVQF